MFCFFFAGYGRACDRAAAVSVAVRQSTLGSLSDWVAGCSSPHGPPPAHLWPLSTMPQLCTYTCVCTYVCMYVCIIITCSLEPRLTFGTNTTLKLTAILVVNGFPPLTITSLSLWVLLMPVHYNNYYGKSEPGFEASMYIICIKFGMSVCICW